MNILFVAGFGPIVQDREADAIQGFYASLLGIDFERDGSYFHTEKLDGVKHYALWPLSQAAESCFGVGEWPADVPTPHSWIEMDVDDVKRATEELERAGHHVLVANRTEPWGQIVTRLLSPDGALLGLTYTPFFRD